MQRKPNMSPQYFDETKKKGEVNELRLLLSNTLNNDTNKRRDIIKKVIAFMTLGIDVSSLFAEMIKASYTNDLIQKKMIYLYLGNYAESNAELVVLVISAYQRDLMNADPKIRGLALRSLFNMKFPGVEEFLPNAVQKAINDPDPYVKKTAIIASIKLFYLKGMKIEEMNDIIDTLYSLIRDPDPLVSTNSIMALDEILQEEGGIVINSKMIIYLLNRIKEYNEYGQSVILELVAKYKPRSESELFDIMNILDERLKHSSSSIVLGCIKIFLNFTKDNPTIHKQVYERILSPLITLVTSGEVTGSYEMAYIVLSHILFIVSRGGNQFFEKEYKNFYCRTDEPSYIKHIKLEILKWVASQETLGDIMNELGEYVTDIDLELAKRSIQTLGGIALRIPNTHDAIIKQLCGFLGYQQNHIANETMIIFQDILRKFKDAYEDIIQILETTVDYITEPEAKCSLIWVFGEFGENIEDAPYTLEALVDHMKANCESTKIKKTLLASVVRLFLKRPPEMVNTLTKLMSQIIADENEDFDLRDRAIFYCKALQHNIDSLKTSIEQSSITGELFLEEEEINKEGATLEFNTLAVIFRKPAQKFVKSIAYLNQMKAKEQEELAAEEKQAQVQEEINAKFTKDPQVDYVVNGSEVYNNDLINLDNVNFNIPGEQSRQELVQITLEDLMPNFEINGELFQSKWAEWPECSNLVRLLKNVDAITVERLEEAMQMQNIYCIASGEQDNEMRLYFYGKLKKEDQLFIMELQINRTNQELSVSIKIESQEAGLSLAKYIEDCFRDWQLLL